MSLTAAEVLFQHVVGKADDAIDLAAALLVLGEFEYPDIDINAYLERLDHLAEKINALAGKQASRRDTLECMLSVLFDPIEGFRGNRSHYYDPKNSFFNEVLDRQLGIPVTLGVVVMEVGMRLGLNVVGVNFPGHFMVRYADDQGYAIMDPFDRCARMSPEVLERRLRKEVGPVADITAEHLEECSKREVVARVLRNLGAIYQRHGDHDRHLAVVERMVILEPKRTGLIAIRDEIIQKISLKN